MRVGKPLFYQAPGWSPIVWTTFRSGLNPTVGDIQIPLIIRSGEREIWVDVHHPLVDPTALPSSVALKAQSNFCELVQIDAFTLFHDLPSAVATLNLPDGWLS